MSFTDLFAVMLVVALPLYGVWSWRRFRRRMEEGRPGTRLAMYGETIALEWSLVAILLVGWIMLEANPAGLGLTFETSRGSIATMVVALVLSGFLLSQVGSVRRMGESPDERLVKQLASVEEMMPHDEGERAVFMTLSMTAGFCEELLFRGFLIEYFTPMTGLWGAVGSSAVIFGIAHSYQGPAGMVKTGLVGLVMGALFLFSGSIWAAVILHLALDIQGGLIGYEVFSRKKRQERVADVLAG